MANVEKAQAIGAATNVVYKAPAPRSPEGAGVVKPDMGVKLDTAFGSMKVKQEEPKPLEQEKGRDYSSDGIGVSERLIMSKPDTTASRQVQTNNALKPAPAETGQIISKVG